LATRLLVMCYGNQGTYARFRERPLIKPAIQAHQGDCTPTKLQKHILRSGGNRRRRGPNESGSGDQDMNTTHKQVFVRVGDMEAEVDQGIAALIREIWKAGIGTLNSCQENQPGIVWIEFVTCEDARCFLNIVAAYEDGLDTLYNRARQGWNPIDEDDMMHPFWSYDIHPEDLALQEEIDDAGDVLAETHPGAPEFEFSVSIRFPECDYPLVLKRLKEHNAKSRVRPECVADPA